MSSTLPRKVDGTGSWAPSKILLDALEGLSAFDEMSTVRTCAGVVEQLLGVRMNLPESPRRRTYLMTLLSAVSEHRNGWQALGSAVDYVEGDTFSAQRVRTAIAVTEVPLFSPEEWAELMTLLSGLQIPELPWLYQEVMAYRGEPPPPAHCAEPWLAVLHAATFNARPGEPPPCVQLVARLARHVKGPQAAGLASWAAAHGMATLSGVSPTGPRGELPESGAPSPLGPTAPATLPGTPVQTRSDPADDPRVWRPGAGLLVRVKPLPDPDHDKERLLSHWWQLGPFPARPIRGEDRRIDLRRLSEWVAALVEEAEAGWAYFYKDDLTLEFFLPRELLELPVESWSKRPLLGANGVLGEDHPVLLRSLDRMERPDTHGRWAKRWDHLARGEEGRAHWFPEDGRARLLIDPLPALVVLSSPPRRRGEQETEFDELGECLRVGVPVVVWDRREGHDPVFRRDLADLLARRGATDLPDAVRELRILARDDDPERASSLIGRHLALLWDDPYRLPEDPRGTATPEADRGES
ncbi:effector-associated domain 2-containing protein [Streptomyces sp. FR-108]|uniref:VMAP-C domain-containing protein n=1 Tax=Streptomyces sp. FR-108 TaxID=3416665 RepID=UPI003CEF644D